MTVPRERPILFSGPMVRAILEGRKTETRRLIMPQPVDISSAEPGDLVFLGGELHRVAASRGRNKAAAGELIARPVVSPHGEPGDRLWVRETIRGRHFGHGSWRALYAADESPVDLRPFYAAPPGLPELSCFDRSRPVTPSIHMPRWASRILLEVAGGREEQLQEIDHAGAVAEGMLQSGSGWLNRLDDVVYPSATAAFAAAWDLIHPEFPFALNPWVRQTGFRVLRPAGKEAAA